MTDRFALYLLFAGCVLFGAIIFVEIAPAGGDHAAVIEVPARPEAAPAVRREPSAKLDERLATALARPLFSSSRRPPQTADDNAATDSELSDTRLTGIVTEPGRHIAIFVLSGAAKPLTVTEGETVSGWRIESITPREVSLSGPSGTKTLQPKVDPNLAPPPGAPPGPPPAPPPNAANVGARVRAQPAAAAPMPPRPGVVPAVPNPPLRPWQARGPR